MGDFSDLAEKNPIKEQDAKSISEARKFNVCIKRLWNGRQTLKKGYAIREKPE